MAGNIVVEQSIAANDTVENILSGSAYEFLRGRSFVSMGITQSATGLQATIQAGGTVIAEEFSVPIEDSYPDTNEDFYFNTFGVAGDRLVIRVRNTTGGALTVRAVVQIADV